MNWEKFDNRVSFCLLTLTIAGLLVFSVFAIAVMLG